MKESGAGLGWLESGRGACMIMTHLDLQHLQEPAELSSTILCSAAASAVEAVTMAT